MELSTSIVTSAASIGWRVACSFIYLALQEADIFARLVFLFVSIYFEEVLLSFFQSLCCAHFDD